MDAFKVVTSALPDAEIRLATFVKCDIVGSTRILRRLDLDEQLLFKRVFESRVTDVAARNAGFVERFEGDGALVVFGYPTVTEDAADAAVRAALELVDAVEAISELPDVQFQLRVGVASGQVAVIQHPTYERSEPVAGHTIDLSERLRGLADPGRVVIDDATRRRAGRFFDYQDLGIVSVKGFEEGVRAWSVVRASSVVSRFEAQRFDDSPSEIVGRDDALATLSDAWSTALKGKGQTVYLSGDAGMGKSRLSRAALDRAAHEGAAVLKIDCTPSTGNTPLFPIGVLLRRTANIVAMTSKQDRRDFARQLLDRFLASSEVDAGLGYLAPLFGVDATLAQTDESPEQVGDKTISMIVGMVRSFADEGPLALLCEDLHWADATTVTVIERVSEQIADLRVLMLVTSRPEPDVRVDLKNAKQIILQPLDASTAANLVRSVAGEVALSEDSIHGIVVRCEGVPLLLEEVTRNSLDSSESRESVPEGVRRGEDVPAPLAMVVQSRLGRWPKLSPIVRAASVLGRDFSVRLLEQMVPNQRADVGDAIALLAKHGLFVQRTPDTGDRARFKHAMICDAVYNTLLGADRKKLHSEAADALSSGYEGTPDGSAEVIAEHLRKALRFAEAIRVRLTASADTASRGAYIETEGHCDAALALISHVKDEEQRRMLQFRLLVQLGVALTGQHGYSAAKVEDAYRNAQALCGDGAEAEMLYPIIRGLAAWNLVRGRLATANELSLRGLQLANQSNRPEFRIDALSVHCYATFYYGRLEDCRSTIDRCLELYRREHGEKLSYPIPQDAATAALALLPTVAWLSGDADAAEAAICEGLEHVERLDRDFDRALFHAWIAGTRYTQRRYRECEEHAKKAVEISQLHGYREWYGTGLLMGLLAQSAQRSAPEAVSQATEACMAFAREGVGLNASYYLWGLAQGHAQTGNRELARVMIAEAFKRAESSAESRMNPELLILQADLESDAAAVFAMLADALRIADNQGAVATALRAAAHLMMRSGKNDADLKEARATLDFLDCRESYPPRPGWMRERLESLRSKLNVHYVTT